MHSRTLTRSASEDVTAHPSLALWVSMVVRSRKFAANMNNPCHYSRVGAAQNLGRNGMTGPAANSRRVGRFREIGASGKGVCDARLSRMN